MSPVETLNQLYFDAIEHRNKPDAFRRKIGGAYRDVSSREFLEAGAEIALGLVDLGLAPGDRIAVLSENRVEWAEADFGILTAGLVSVPVYPTLPAAAVDYVLADSGTRAVFASNAIQAAKVLGRRAADPSFVVIQFDPEGASDGAIPLDALRERGRKLGAADPGLHRRRSDAVRPGDLATLIYTSGTTGPPKGVMLSHANILSNVEAALTVFRIGVSDTCLSFLPLSHILERMAGLYTMFYAGCTIAYAESVETVPENLLEVRPTIMVSVPRLYEKMYARVQEAARAGGAVKQTLFRWATRVGAERARHTLARESVPGGLEFRFRIADRLVFSKLKARTGGRLRFFISGGAPLAREIAEFFYSGGLLVVEGYGLTESSPVLAANTPEWIRPGTVGRAFPGVELRLAEDGEILARGPNIMMGYWNRPEDTAGTLRDGWLHTGDIGTLDHDGFLTITDRKKDIIVNSGGKNIAPQPIENAVKTDPFIEEIVVLGDRRPFLVALVVPRFERLEDHAREQGVSTADRRALVADPRIVDFLLTRIATHQGDAASFETVRRILVLDRALTLESDEITPTLKVKRREVARRYATEIDALYEGAQGGP